MSLYVGDMKGIPITNTEQEIRDQSEICLVFVLPFGVYWGIIEILFYCAYKPAWTRIKNHNSQKSTVFLTINCTILTVFDTLPSFLTKIFTSETKYYF